jgi:hypothetical protein
VATTAAVSGGGQRPPLPASAPTAAADSAGHSPSPSAMAAAPTTAAMRHDICNRAAVSGSRPLSTAFPPTAGDGARPWQSLVCRQSNWHGRTDGAGVSPGEGWKRPAFSDDFRQVQAKHDEDGDLMR